MQDALDEAIAAVTWAEFARLKAQYPGNVAARVHRAFESIDRLQSGGLPDYDEWDTPLYMSWYQARQVHLVYATLQQFPPPSSRGPLQVIDFGCGAWAVPIALAILAAEGHEALCNRRVSVHGIEPSKAMTRLGRELWREFGCAAENLDVSIFETEDAYRDARSHSHNTFAESWVLAIHALYDESKSDLKRFLHNCRTHHAKRLRYELLTADGSKMQKLTCLIVSRGSGIWGRGSGIWASQGAMQKGTNLKPIWKGYLSETSKCRARICEDLNEKGNTEGSLIGDKYSKYLFKRVSWHNRWNRDAVWVRNSDAVIMAFRESLQEYLDMEANRDDTV